MGSFLFYKTGHMVLQRRVGITEWHNYYNKMRGGVFQSGTIITKKSRIVQKDSDNSVLEPHPMDTPLSIRHRFDVKFPWKVRENYIDFERRIYVEIMTWIFRRGFAFPNRRNTDEFSTWIFLCRFDVKSTSVVAVSIL